MRLLADENFPRPIVEALRTLGHDVLWQTAVQRRTPLKQSGVVLFRTHPAIPENLDPLVRAFVEGNRARTGHISIISAEGIQMLSAQRK